MVWPFTSPDPEGVAAKNDEATKTFAKDIGGAGDNMEGTFLYFLSDGCLKLRWSMRRLLDTESKEVSGLIFRVKALKFYPPKTTAEDNLLRLAYLQFVKVATNLCASKGWTLEFELVDSILHDVIRPDLEFSGDAAETANSAWKFRRDRLKSTRSIQNLETNMQKTGVEYDKRRVDFGDCTANEPRASAEASKASKKSAKGDGDSKKSEDKVVVARRPFYMCRNGNCDGLDSLYCYCDEYGCCDNDDDLVRSFGRRYGDRGLYFPRRPFYSRKDPGRIVVLGRSGTSAAAADLKRRFPGKEVHVRKWGPSANSYLRENPLNSRNQVEVYGPSGASRASLRALSRASRRGADVSVY